MASNLQITLDGTISVGSEKDRCSYDSALTGPVFTLLFLAVNAALTEEVSSIRQTIDTQVYLALPIPAAMRGRVFYIRRQSSVESSYMLRFTYHDDTTEVLTCVGCLFREVSSANPIKTVEIIGSGTFEWIFAGLLA